MTDKEYREQKKRVKKYFDKWMTPLGLRWYRTHFDWERERNPDESREVMRTEVTWEYREATFYIRLPRCADVDDEELEHIVVHECVHALTGGFMSSMDLDNPAVRQIMENTTEQVACAILWAREAGRKDK